MFLGAAHFQLPPLIYAKKTGYFTITCDNVKNNPGHNIADKSYNVSTTNTEGILRIAQKERIDGILAFGSDLSMITCAKVSNYLQLPGNTLSTIEKMVYKSKFRKFLNDKGIEKVDYKLFSNYQRNELILKLSTIKRRYIIKPIDGNGSKGVSIINPKENPTKKIQNAFLHSLKKKIILEPFIDKKGPQICGDGIVKNGKIEYIFFGDGHFYPGLNFLAPWGETFPSIHSKKILRNAKSKISKTLELLNFRDGPFNFDIFVTRNDEIFINEIGPRSGGNFIPTIIKKQMGVNMIKGAVESCLGHPYKISPSKKRENKYYGSYMMHSKKVNGNFISIKISDKVLSKVNSITLFKKKHEMVKKFISGNHAIGNVIFETDSLKEMHSLYENDLHSMFNIKIK